MTAAAFEGEHRRSDIPVVCAGVSVACFQYFKSVRNYRLCMLCFELGTRLATSLQAFSGNYDTTYTCSTDRVCVSSDIGVFLVLRVTSERKSSR